MFDVELFVETFDGRPNNSELEVSRALSSSWLAGLTVVIRKVVKLDCIADRKCATFARVALTAMLRCKFVQIC